MPAQHGVLEAEVVVDTEAFIRLAPNSGICAGGEVDSSYCEV